MIICLIVRFADGPVGSKGEGGGPFEEAGEEDAHAFFGLLAAEAVAFGDGDEGVLGAGDLDDGGEDLGLTPGVEAVLEGVEVAYWGAGTGAAAAPAGMFVGRWKMDGGR